MWPHWRYTLFQFLVKTLNSPWKLRTMIQFPFHSLICDKHPTLLSIRERSTTQKYYSLDRMCAGEDGSRRIISKLLTIGVNCCPMVWSLNLQTVMTFINQSWYRTSTIRIHYDRLRKLSHFPQTNTGCNASLRCYDKKKWRQSSILISTYDVTYNSHFYKSLGTKPRRFNYVLDFRKIFKKTKPLLISLRRNSFWSPYDEEEIGRPLCIQHVLLEQLSLEQQKGTHKEYRCCSEWHCHRDYLEIQRPKRLNQHKDGENFEQKGGRICIRRETNHSGINRVPNYLWQNDENHPKRINEKALPVSSSPVCVCVCVCVTPLQSINLPVLYFLSNTYI